MKGTIYFFILTIFFNLSVLAQHYDLDNARNLFNDGKYSAAQFILSELSNLNTVDEEVLLLSAKCSKELFLSDAVLLYNELNMRFPYHQYKNEVNIDLALIYYRVKNYSVAVEYFSRAKELTNEQMFKMAYSNFMIDSLSDAQYYFSNLISLNSKFSSTSQYYYSYILYKKGLYKTALVGFKNLLNDEDFRQIVPYYISQIYFYQKKYKELITFIEPLSEKVISARKFEINRLLADAYYNTADYANAINYYESILADNSINSSLVHFLLGYSYFKKSDYLNAITNLEKVSRSSDSLLQYSSYYLGCSYLALENYNYALQAFKRSSIFNYNLELQEDAFFNYAKLSYQLELPFDNTLNILQTYLRDYEHSIHKKEIETLIVEVLQGTSKYKEAYDVLIGLDTLSYNQKIYFEKLSFFLGVISYNQKEFKLAISYFNDARSYNFNAEYYYLSSFWLADCYYQLNNFENAISIYSDLSVGKSGNIADYQILKKYNLAYAYFQNKNYKAANKWFRLYEKVASDSIRLNDTYLRIADSYFMTTNFYLADKYYEKSINYNLFDVDYATYNQSVCLGLIGDDAKKIKLLKNFISNFKFSSYYNNALYDLAKYYKITLQYDSAIEYYNMLIKQSKNDDFIADAYLSKGMISFNRGDIEEAIKEFLFVINNCHHTIYFKEALAGLQLAYSSIAKIDEYLKVVESLPDFRITKSEEDTLCYNAAFLKFSEMEYKVAKVTFDKYIDNFSDGIFIDDALYYNAISSLRIKDTISAITCYKKIVKSQISIYKESALIFLARYSYSNSDFKNSNQYYSLLNNYASSNSLKREIIIRLMSGNDELNTEDAVKYAKQVIELDKIDDWLLSKANIIIARNEFDSGNYVKSKKIFQEVIDLSEYDEGAEAKYFLSYLTFLNDSLMLAEQLIFELADNYTNDHFIAKAFILLSDIYERKGNIFQAKATLESIIENHDGLDLINIARKKWECLIEYENTIVFEKLDDQAFIEISEEDFEYEVEEIDDEYMVPIQEKSIHIDSLKVINENIF